jgi:ZIP family zinc transporter
MLTLSIVVAVVSGALIAGALWGAFGKLPDQLEGFLIALAGGALILSVVTELIQPSIDEASLATAALWTLIGAAVFTGIDYLVDEHWGSDKGGGLLAAITLDGLPENLALGVALIGADALAVAALAGSILLSNLPEAAGGAREMVKGGMSKAGALALWAGTAALLGGSAVAGNLLFESAPPPALAAVRCFAAGAVIASLATEVFPKAFKEDRHLSGIATCLGFLLALILSEGLGA